MPDQLAMSVPSLSTLIRACAAGCVILSQPNKQVKPATKIRPHRIIRAAFIKSNCSIPPYSIIRPPGCHDFLVNLRCILVVRGFSILHTFRTLEINVATKLFVTARNRVPCPNCQHSASLRLICSFGSFVILSALDIRHSSLPPVPSVSSA